MCLPNVSAPSHPGGAVRDEDIKSIGMSETIIRTPNTGLCSSLCTDCGIFTTTTGTSPNRVFYIEYRTSYFFDTQRDLTNNLLGTLTALTIISIHAAVARKRAEARGFEPVLPNAST